MPNREIVKSKPFYRKSLFLASILFGTLFAANLAVIVYFSYRISRDRLQEHIEEDLALATKVYQKKVQEQVRDFLQTQNLDFSLLRLREIEFEVVVYVNGIPTRRGRMIEAHIVDENGVILQSFPPTGPGADMQSRAALKVDPTNRVQYEKKPTGRQRLESLGKVDYTVSFPVIEMAPTEDWKETHAVQLRGQFLPMLVLGPLVSLVLLGISFLYIIRLIRQSQRLEAEAQIADRLAYVGSIASGLAHEIRNPLNAMAVNLQMLEEEIESARTGNVDEARSMIGGAMNEVTRLNLLVTQFLDYARPARPELAESDCNEIVADTLDFLRGDLQAGRIEVRRHLDGWLPKVSIDPRQIRQALMNILLNAKQVLSAGGQIEVSTRRGRDGAVRIAIADNGPGIAPEDREQIFRIFFSTRGGGTGMGLPIARKILENHGGSIEVDSRPGDGTTFTLVLPVATRRGGSGSHPVAAAHFADAAVKR